MDIYFPTLEEVECISCHRTGILLNCDNICNECYTFHEEQRKKYHIGKGKNKKYKTPIPSKIRWEIWERDNFTCQHCGKRKNLTIDHIHPESKGGTLDLSNLQTLCKSCNSKKGAK